MRDTLREEQPEPVHKVPHTFVGRVSELDALEAALEDAIGGRGRLLLVTGEPGIGKTTLAEQLAARALARGVRVLWGRCWEGGGAPAYWPWTQILRPLLGQQGNPVEAGGPSPWADLKSLFPHSAKRLGEGQRALTQSAAARFRLFTAVATLLDQASSTQPLLTIVDDLHAADDASLSLLQFLARDLRHQRLLVIGTYRDSEVTLRADLAEVLGTLVREGPTLRLQGFDHGEVRRFVANLAGAGTSDAELLRIGEATGGNPLFIRELVSLAGSRDRPGWHWSPAVSTGVRKVIHQRLSALGADASRVLAIAAVVGQDFEARLVERVSALAIADVLESVAQAERAELVVRAPASLTAFRFAHGLVREVLYDDLPAAVRRELHGKVAAAIESLYEGDLAPHLAQLAHHYGEVSSPDAAAKVVEYGRLAGDQAMTSHAYEEAAFQYRRALDALLVRPDDALRCELLLRLGGTRVRSGDYKEGKASFLRAAEIARRLVDPEQLSRAALGFGEPQVEGGLVDQQLLTFLQEALDRLSPDDSALRVRLLARFSMELTFSDDPRLRETLRDNLSRQALEMARRLGDVTAMAIACRARWLAAWGPDGLAERSALSEEMVTLARETGDQEMELVSRARRLTCSLEQGNLRAVDDDLAAHARLASELRMPYHEWTSATLRAGRLLLDGSFEAAEKLAEQARTMLPGGPNVQLAYLNQITPIRWEQGRLAELREEWATRMEQFPQAGFGTGWLALAEAEGGRQDEAKRRLRLLVEVVPQLPRGGLWLPTLATASLAASHLDDPDAANTIFSLLQPYAGRAIAIPIPHPVMCFGSASLYLAILATIASRWAEAVEHFDSAIRANTHLGAWPFLARTQVEYARMLLRRGQTEDRERAVALLDQADAIAYNQGMAALGREIERLRETRAYVAPAPGQGKTVDIPAVRSRNSFQQEGDYRTINYEGTHVLLRDSKGLRILARLLAAPGREFHAVDLEREQNGTVSQTLAPGHRPGLDELKERPDLGDAGAMLDAEAKAAYRARLRDLEAELDEAEAWADSERAATTREERDFLVAELARAVGLGGRDRRAASHAERARLNVTRAIKSALDHIDRQVPALGRHLRATVRTGNYCSYSPDPRVPVDWQL